MNIQNTGASRRRTLSSRFGEKAKARAMRQARPSPTIPRHELRLLVAEMID